jgi:hypothetical protein
LQSQLTGNRKTSPRMSALNSLDQSESWQLLTSC